MTTTYTPRSMAGDLLQRVRRSLGLTQEALAERLEVDPGTVQSWESGRRPLAARSAADLIRFYRQLVDLGAPADASRRFGDALEQDTQAAPLRRAAA